MTLRGSLDLATVADRLESEIKRFAKFSRPGEGVTRLSFTHEYEAAISYLSGEFEKLGFRTKFDPVGNFIASNVEPGERCVALGSHVDSVPRGGRFDGTAGVLCALEVARLAPNLPLKVFSFVEEEGARFGSGLLGSRCVVGEVTADELKEHRDSEGTSFHEAAGEAGCDPDRVEDCAQSLVGVECYLEIHIEQGRVLEGSGEEIGVVEAIAGVVHAQLEIEGRADHAGATPMNLRSDAALTAAETVVELDRVAREVGGSAVGTVGKIELSPNALNVIPGLATVGLDVRDVDEGRRDEILKGITRFAQKRADGRGQSVVYLEHLRSEPKLMDPSLTTTLKGAADRLGIPHQAMPSGAGHDAMIVARRVPAGMLFVPSRGGVSHAPEEFTEFRHLAGAVAVLQEAIGGGHVTDREAV